MRTPAGTECKYFYGDYYRGRSQEECRLLAASQTGRSLLSGFQRRVQVVAYCRKTERPVDKPHVGCGECHPLPAPFEVKE
jgi:hypothetical protein